MLLHFLLKCINEFLENHRFGKHESLRMAKTPKKLTENDLLNAY